MATTGEDVLISFGAQFTQLQAAFTEVEGLLNGLVAQVREAGAATVEASSIIDGAFVGIAEAATVAKERVVGTFEEVHHTVEGISRAFLLFTGALAGGAIFGEIIRDVIQLDERVTSLQRSLGLTREAALETDVGLRLIGKSSSEYEHILMALERGVRTHEQRMNALGIATRDASGEYLKLPQIFQNALAAMQTYKVGTDQAGFAQEVFKRSALEMYSYLDLTDPIMERAKQIIHDFGIELQSHDAMLAYKVDLAALGMAGEAVGHQISEQLMPALMGLSAWFSGQGSGAIKLFGTVLKGLASAFIDAGALFQQFKVTMATTWDQITEIMSSAALKGKAIMTGAWSDLERLSQEHETRMAGIAAAGAEEIVQITLREANALRAIWGANGEGIKLPEVHVEGPKGGGRSYAPEGKKEHTRKGKADQSRLSEWRAELQQQLMAEENYFDESKKEELAFWQDKLQYTKAGSKEQQEVEGEIYRLKKQLAHDDEREALQGLEFDRKINDEKFNRAKQYVAAQEAMGKLSATEALRTEEQLLDQKWAADAAYYQKEMAAAEKDAATHKKLDQEMLLAHEKYITQKQQLELKVAEETAKKEKAIDDEIATQLSNAIMGALSGSKGQTGAQQFAKAIGDAIKKYVGDALTSVLKKAFEASPIGKMLSGFGDKIGSMFGNLFGKAGDAAGGVAGNAAGSAALGPAAATLQTGATTLEAGATQLQAAATTLQGAATASGAGGAGGAGGSAAVVSAIEAEPALAATAMTPILTAALAPVITLLTTMNASLIALNAKPSILGTSYDSGGVVPSAEGGMVNDGKGGSLAILHPNEMVLPAPLSAGLQRLIGSIPSTLRPANANAGPVQVAMPDIGASLAQGLRRMMAPNPVNGYALPTANFNIPAPSQPALPPDIAAQLGGAGGGRGVTVVNNNISAVDAAGVAKFFRANSHSLVAAVNAGQRQGSALRVPQQ